MAKKASKSVQRNNAQMRVTVYYGYALFLFVCVGLLWTLFPWVNFISSSWARYPEGNLMSITLLVCFVFTALAPALVGYLAGDSATRSKSKLLHHFNGVLFGVLGVWLWVVLAMVSSYAQQWLTVTSEWSPVVTALVPPAVAAVGAITLAFYYARSTKHQVSLLHYRPYQALIISAALLLVIATAATGATAARYDEFFTLMLTYLIVPLLFMLVGTLAGYWIIGKAGGDSWERFTRSLVAAGLALLTLTIITQYAGYFSAIIQFIGTIALIGVIGVWLSYLLLMRRALKK